MEVIQLTEDKIPTTREQMFKELYVSVFPDVARFVSQMRGSFQDAKDIFQDALVIYYERTQNSQPQAVANQERYILGIARHLWFKKFNQGVKRHSVDVSEVAAAIPEDYFQPVQEKRLLLLLERTGRKCLDLLRAFYYENVPLKKITERLGYRNEHTASVQKYKCIEKMRDTIKQKSISYEDFFE